MSEYQTKPGKAARGAKLADMRDLLAKAWRDGWFAYRGDEASNWHERGEDVERYALQYADRLIREAGER